MMTRLKLTAFLLMGAIGCATPGTPAAKNATDDEVAQPAPAKAAAKPVAAETAPAPEPDANANANPAPVAAPAAPKPAKKVKVADREQFDAAMAKWDAAKANGPIGKKSCNSLADAFQDVGKGHPDVAAQAYFNAGTILDGCGDEKGAIEQYQAALANNPKFGWALNNLGEIAYRHGNVAEARAKFEAAIAADPTHVASAYNNLAVILFQDGRDGNQGAFRDAISKLRRALAIENDSMPAYALLALIYYTTAENDKSKLALAELVCKQGKETNKDYAPIYNTLGLIQLRKKNVTGALKEFEEAVKLDPKYVEAHLNIGAIGLSSRQYEKAEASFTQVLKLQPNNVDATIGLGVAYRGQKKVEEAEKMYKKAAELDPKNCAVPYNLGVLYQDYKNDASNQNLKEAQKYYGAYVSCGKTDKRKVDDAQRRIKDIDDTFAALEQQKKMEAELKAQQEEMEKQQKQMEEQQKQQQQQAPQGEPAKGGDAAAPKAEAEPKAKK